MTVEVNQDLNKIEKIKKIWLLITIASYLVFPVLILSIILALDLKKPLFFITFFFNIISFTWLFNASYKKSNTGFLTFCLACGLVSIPLQMWKFTFGIISVVQLIKHYGNESSLPFLPCLLFGFTFLNIICSSFWCYFSWKLRIYNKINQEQAILNTPGYQPTILGICNALDADTLMEVYGQGVRNHPEVAGFLKKQYKSRLQSLKSLS